MMLPMAIMSAINITIGSRWVVQGAVQVAATSRVFLPAAVLGCTVLMQTSGHGWPLVMRIHATLHLKLLLKALWGTGLHAERGLWGTPSAVQD